MHGNFYVWNPHPESSSCRTSLLPPTAMKAGNQSTVTEFILLGFTNYPELQVIFFLLFLLVYTFTLLGNISLLLIVWCSANLHTPMYFFLTQLSFLDLTFASVFAPKMLLDLIGKKKTISFYGCVTQMFFFAAIGSTEFFLLAVMAFDRYVAVCSPLLYTLTMSQRLCVRLVAGSYVGGFLHSLIHASCLQRLYFCGPNVMNHYACDYPVLLKLSCNDISINDSLRFVFAAFVVISSLLVIVVSYSYIVTAILRITTTARRHRAASTCISHFTCVFFFYGTAFFMEIRPNSASSEEQYKMVSVIPTVVVPALNPLIYSLRNNEVKEALRKLLYQTSCW
ncbi:olfactory receptor 5J3-like [Pleurodeles waltl]|uniref:olfactory receptor 5J3-like n=1 Tax=Pleurodeles waltl TaxID=8319 RepID=UPI0037095DC1